MNCHTLIVFVLMRLSKQMVTLAPKRLQAAPFRCSHEPHVA